MYEAQCALLLPISRLPRNGIKVHFAKNVKRTVHFISFLGNREIISWLVTYLLKKNLDFLVGKQPTY